MSKIKFKIDPWRAATALLIALGMVTGVTAPLLVSTPAAAQRSSPNSNKTVIPSGTRISVAYDDAEKIIVTPEERMPLTLIVAEDVSNNSGKVLIPMGSKIVGELQPAGGGTKFVARRLIIQDRTRVRLDADSDIVTRMETLDKGTNVSAVLQGAVIGAAAATLISAITGDRAIATEEVLGGAGLGAIGGVVFGNRKAEVIVIYPEDDLELRVRSDIVLR